MTAILRLHFLVSKHNAPEREKRQTMKVKERKRERMGEKMRERETIRVKERENETENEGA